jgi:hypothetical protein
VFYAIVGAGRVYLQSRRFVDNMSETVSPDYILTHTDRFELPSPAEQVMLRRELSSVCGEQADVVLIVELSARRTFASVCGVEHISRNRQTACPDEAMRSRVDCCTRHLRGVSQRLHALLPALTFDRGCMSWCSSVLRPGSGLAYRELCVTIK